MMPETTPEVLQARSRGRSMAVYALILACALWGASFPLIKVLHLEQTARIPEASSVFLAAWLQVARFLAAVILLLLCQCLAATPPEASCAVDRTDALKKPFMLIRTG